MAELLLIVSEALELDSIIVVGALVEVLVELPPQEASAVAQAAKQRAETFLFNFNFTGAGYERIVHIAGHSWF